MRLVDVGRVEVLSVAVELDAGRLPTLAAMKRDPRWKLAVDELEAEVRRGGRRVEFVQLEDPRAVDRLWHVHRGAATFQCVVQYSIGDFERPPSWLGRVSLAILPVQIEICTSV